MNAPLRSQAAGLRKPYRRSMAGWWRKNPYFVEYMIHEATALFVALYALILLAGVVCLANGRHAWGDWVAWMSSPLSIGLHSVILIAFAYHAWTWFHIMPRTLPPIHAGGRRLSGVTITRIGLLAALVSSAILLAIARGLAK